MTGTSPLLPDPLGPCRGPSDQGPVRSLEREQLGVRVVGVKEDEGIRGPAGAGLGLPASRADADPARAHGEVARRATGAGGHDGQAQSPRKCPSVTYLS